MMMSSAIIPQPLARLPWRLIWLVALICTIGIVTLFSAAGGSWSNPVLLQKQSQIWGERRARLAASEAAYLLDGLLEIDGRELVARYHDDLPATTCHMAVQLAWHFDELASKSRSAARTCEPGHA